MTQKETLKNIWTLVSISSSIDRDNNTLSLFDILEELTVQVSGTMPEQAVVPVNHTLMSVWSREDTSKPMSLKFKILLRDSHGKILHENEAEIKLAEGNKNARFRAQLNGFPVTSEGQYRYEVISLEPEKTGGKELVNTVNIEVHFAQQAVKSPLSPA